MYGCNGNGFSKKCDTCRYIVLICTRHAIVSGVPTQILFIIFPFFIFIENTIYTGSKWNSQYLALLDQQFLSVHIIGTLKIYCARNFAKLCVSDVASCHDSVFIIDSRINMSLCSSANCTIRSSALSESDDISAILNP